MTLNPEVKAAPENEAIAKEQVAAVSNNTETQNNQQSNAESNKEINWKAFREAREIERKQAEEMSRQARKSQEEAAALKAALDAVLNKQTSAPQYANEDMEETEEQRIEKKVIELLSKKEAEAEKRRLEKEAQELPVKINREFKDFDQVCSAENLDYLDYHYPEVARAFEHMPQGFEKWSSIYRAVKRFVPNVDAKKDLAKAEKNLNKPQSVSSPGTAQGSQGAAQFKLDDKRKAENYERMRRVMNKLE